MLGLGVSYGFTHIMFMMKHYLVVCRRYCDNYEREDVSVVDLYAPTHQSVNHSALVLELLQA